MLKSILNIFKCNLISSHVCSYDGNNKQLFHVSLYYGNCIKLYINDVLVPKQSVYLVSRYKNTHTIKVKLCGLFNSQTVFLQLKVASLEVNFSLFEKINTLSVLEPIKIVYHKKFYLSSIITPLNVRVEKRMERTQAVNFSKTLKLETKIRNQNYTLTNITNNYEQTNLSNT